MSNESNNLTTDELVSTYFKEIKVLVVDSVENSRVNLVSSVSKLGVLQSNILFTNSIIEAKKLIKEHKIKVIFSDYIIDNKSGLDLVQSQKDTFSEEDAKTNLFVLVTSDAAQSTVAKAVEEDVDTFVLKPYSFDGFKEAVFGAVLNKINPDQYTLTVNEGKSLLFKGEIDKAKSKFELALTLSEKPTLAYYYLAQSEEVKTALTDASLLYDNGLKISKIHFKCLVGLSELMLKQRKHQEAYDLLKKLVNNFPSNGKRLASILRLAILTENYSDVLNYYNIFKNVEEKSEECIRHMCSALIVSGKYILQNYEKSSGLDHFEKAAICANGRTGFLRFIIEILIDNKLFLEAPKFLEHFLPTSRVEKDYLVCFYLISGKTQNPLKVIDWGKKLFKRGIFDFKIYQTLIRNLLKEGQKEEALVYIAEAKAKYNKENVEELIQLEFEINTSNNQDSKVG
jgi:CheY-like chemotaxis protein